MIEGASAALFRIVLTASYPVLRLTEHHDIRVFGYPANDPINMRFYAETTVGRVQYFIALIEQAGFQPYKMWYDQSSDDLEYGYPYIEYRRAVGGRDDWGIADYATTLQWTRGWIISSADELCPDCEAIKKGTLVND